MKRLNTNQITIILLYALCLLIFAATNPQHLPVSLLLVPLIALFIAFLFTTRWVVFKIASRKNSKLSKKRLGTLAIILAGFPFLCILLQSIGQFSLRDLAMLAVFFSVLWFYLVRSQAVS